MTEQNWLKYGAIALAVVAGVLLVAYALSQPGELEGRTWAVQEMTVDGATVQPLEGTVITANFENGTVAGIATCNNYFASYEVDGSSIAIGPIGTTLMACVGVPGSDVQEAAYLTLLGSADEYDVDGDELKLKSGGSTVPVYAEVTPELYEN